MAVRQPRHSKEDFAQRGDTLCESEVRQQVEEGNQFKMGWSRLKPYRSRVKVSR